MYNILESNLSSNLVHSNDRLLPIYSTIDQNLVKFPENDIVYIEYDLKLGDFKSITSPTSLEDGV